MKNQLLCFSVILAFAGSIAPTALALSYSNDELHYSFSLPLNWVKLPPKMLVEVMKARQQELGDSRFTYVVGFHRSSTQQLEHPYMLVQHDSTRNISLSEIAKAMSEIEKNEELQAFRSIVGFSDIQSMQPIIDYERNFVRLTTTITFPEFGRVRMLTVCFPGKEGMVHLIFYRSSSDYARYTKELKSILDSFAFDEGYEYDPTQAEVRATSRKNTRILLKLGIYGGMLVLFFLFTLARRYFKS